MNGILIRLMQESDLPAILTIERESFPNPWSEQSFLCELRSKTNFSKFFVAECSGGSIAGYAGVWFFYGEGHVANIAIKKDFRAKGIGKSLLNYIIAFAREKGAQKMFLEVAAKNLTARRLYKSFGFKEDGIRRNYYPGDDAMLMSCEI